MEWIEARLVVPLRPNKGSRLDTQAYSWQLLNLEQELVRMFGGFTATDGHGAFDNGDVVQYEAVRVYLIAFDYQDAVACERFEGLRRNVKERLDQRAVYLSHTCLDDAPVQ